MTIMDAPAPLGRNSGNHHSARNLPADISGSSDFNTIGNLIISSEIDKSEKSNFGQEENDKDPLDKNLPDYFSIF